MINETILQRLADEEMCEEHDQVVSGGMCEGSLAARELLKLRADYARLKAAADAMEKALKNYDASWHWIPEIGRQFVRVSKTAQAAYREATR